MGGKELGRSRECARARPVPTLHPTPLAGLLACWLVCSLAGLLPCLRLRPPANRCGKSVLHFCSLLRGAKCFGTCFGKLLRKMLRLRAASEDCFGKCFGASGRFGRLLRICRWGAIAIRNMLLNYEGAPENASGLLSSTTPHQLLAIYPATHPGMHCQPTLGWCVVAGGKWLVGGAWWVVGSG